MLWLIVLALIGVMLFVMFHKPPVNTAGVGIRPPSLPALGPTPRADTSDEQAPVETAQPVDTFNFNDLFSAPKNNGPTDRPSA